MDSKEILDKLNPVFKEVFKEDIKLTSSTSPNDIGSWDSLNHMILIKKIEEEFQFEFDLFDVVELKNVGDIINIIQKNVD
ncbi:MAG: acyl carrier protein [Prolixibacteraceae bacterium]|nr:acyl carrier protein [Prolixibacteraceae bacterium]